MKNAIISFAVLLLIGCSGTHSDQASSSEVGQTQESAEKKAQATSEASKLEPLAEYTGFWVEETNDSEVIQLLSTRDSQTGSFVTKVLGLNLEPDIAYTTSAFADGDNPEIAFHDGRYEALLIKTIEGHRRLIEIAFDFTVKDKATVQVKVSGKTAVRTYTRVATSKKTEQKFYDVQKARAQKIINSAYSDFWKDYCDRPDDLFFLEGVITRHQTKCLTNWVKKFAKPDKLQELLVIAASVRNISAMKVLIEAGADVNAPDAKRQAPAQAAFSSSSHSLGIGEHGFVVSNGLTSEALSVLFDHGLSVDALTSFQFSELFAASNDARFLRRVLDSKADLNGSAAAVLRSLFFSYRARWKEQGPELLKAVIARLGQRTVLEALNDTLISGRMIKDGDADSIKIIKDAGFKFSSEHIASAQQEIAEAREELKKTGTFTAEETRYRQQRIAAIEENIKIAME
jgi:hypothetical protein